LRAEGRHAMRIAEIVGCEKAGELPRLLFS
jgi:hypothetical protein